MDNTRVAQALVRLARGLSGGSRTAGIAETILEQMGGINRIRAMTGASNFAAESSGVSFNFPNRKRSKGNAVRIEYNAGQDLYDMTFYNVSIRGIKKVGSFSGLYFDQLIEIFEKQTGLYLKL